MKRKQFLRHLRKFCKETGKTYDWQKGAGKGSHGTVYVDGFKTIVPDIDLPPFYIDAVLKQLGLPKGVV